MLTAAEARLRGVDEGDQDEDGGRGGEDEAVLFFGGEHGSEILWCSRNCGDFW